MDLPQEHLLVHGEHPHLSQRTDGGGTDLLLEERHLSEEVPFAQLGEADLLPILLMIIKWEYFLKRWRAERLIKPIEINIG